jgi:hypothetical protein
LIHGREHCPYFSAGQPVFTFLDRSSSLSRAGACDLDVEGKSLSNLRILETNPDILLFLVNGGAPGGASKLGLRTE